MHRHLLICSAHIIFENNELVLGILSSESSEGNSERVYSMEFNAHDVFWVNHGVEQIFASTVINDHVEFLGGRFGNGMHRRAVHSGKHIGAKGCR